MNTPTPTLRHLPQLDGVRAIAVILVLIEHYGPNDDEAFRSLLLGPIGVRLFFVLSGFLITGILLDCRRAAKSGTPHRHLLLAFYARRSLRIFPVFYLALSILAYVNRNSPTFQPAWHAAYLSNWHFWLTGVHTAGGHFWSLAVEEQFYLCWPWVALFARLQWLVPACLFMLLCGPVSRAIVSGQFAEWITPACLDSLGAGCLLAIAPNRQQFCRCCLVAGIAATAIGVGVFPPLIYFGLSLLFAWLTGAAATGVPGIGGRLLSSRFLTGIGVISYGLYVWHLVVPSLFLGIANRFGLSLPSHWLPFGLLSLVGTLMVALVSWFCFERPINALKRYFPYRITASASPPRVPA